MGGDAKLRHIDRASASTVHAYQGRTVDTVIAAMEANHPNLTTQKALYVEISRTRGRAELVTDDREALRAKLEAVTGEQIAALEAVGQEKPGAVKGRGLVTEAGKDKDKSKELEGGPVLSKDHEQERTKKSKRPDRGIEL